MSCTLVQYVSDADCDKPYIYDVNSYCFLAIYGVHSYLIVCPAGL